MRANSHFAFRISQSCKAFTLLELILAMTIASLIALVVYQALAASFRARDVARDQTDLPREAAILLDLIEADFSSVALPSSSTSSGTTLNGPFVGYSLSAGGARESHSLSYCSLQHDRTLQKDRTQRVELTLKDDARGQLSLLRRVQPNLLASVLPEPVDETLSTRVTSFEVRYYDGNGWTDTWDSTQLQDALPLAVSVTIELAAPAQHCAQRADARPYTATRIIPIACGKPATEGGGA